MTEQSRLITKEQYDEYIAFKNGELTPKDSLTVREKPFYITETGLYKTRDGRKAFIAYLHRAYTGDVIGVYGVVEGMGEYIRWNNENECQLDVSNKQALDIISKWTEE